MKKLLLLSIIVFCCSAAISAQNKTNSIGLVISYDILQKGNNYYYYNSEENKNATVSFGLEFSETKKHWGYRTGMFYTRVKNQSQYDFQYFYDYILIDVYYEPQASPLQIIDFPISGQVYLPVGKTPLRLYVNMGLMASLAIYDNNDLYYYNDGSDSKSMSFRLIAGGGLSYQFTRHFELDMSCNQRSNIHTLDDNFRRPFNSLGIQTKMNYIF